MDPNTAPRTERLEAFRNYLRLLACIQLPPARTETEPEAIVDETLTQARLSGMTADPTRADVAGRLRNLLTEKIRDHLRAEATAADDPKLEAALLAFVSRAGERIKRWLAVADLSAAAPAERERPLYRLADALAGLTPPERLAVELKHLQGWTIAAIRAQMGESEIAVAGHLRRGLMKLRNLLGEGHGDPQ
jgi:RNA polymerase sigma-70 factor (ECF subfamily)